MVDVQFKAAIEHCTAQGYRNRLLLPPQKVEYQQYLYVYSQQLQPQPRILAGLFCPQPGPNHKPLPGMRLWVDPPSAEGSGRFRSD